MSLQGTVRQGCPAHGLGPQPLRQTDRRDPRVPDRPGGHRGHQQRRHRGRPDRRDLPGPVQLRHDAAGVPVFPGPAGLPGPGQRGRHPGGKRLRFRFGRLPAGHQVPAGRHRQDRPGDRRREDDPRRGRRGGRRPAGRRLRHGRPDLHHRLHGPVRRRRQALRKALRITYRDVLGTIAAKNHRNGVDNPYAQLRKDLGEEFCRTVSDKNPMVADPLRRTDCSPVSDGAAAVVLSTSPTGGATAPVRLAGFGHANDFFPAERRDPTAFAATRMSWQRALAMAGVGLEDLDFAEVHDCFTIAELLMYEAMGLTEPGQGARAVTEGWVFKDGKLPINVSGGLKAKGHPVGATGVSQHVIAAMQLTGTAGDMQLAAPAPGRRPEHGRRGHRQLRQRPRGRLSHATRGQIMPFPGRIIGPVLTPRCTSAQASGPGSGWRSPQSPAARRSPGRCDLADPGCRGPRRRPGAGAPRPAAWARRC